MIKNILKNQNFNCFVNIHITCSNQIFADFSPHENQRGFETENYIRWISIQK